MSTEKCIHELNPNGGFASQHRRFCANRDCAEEATVHVEVEGRWCANLCGKCGGKIAAHHRVAMGETLRGLEGR